MSKYTYLKLRYGNEYTEILNLIQYNYDLKEICDDLETVLYTLSTCDDQSDMSPVVLADYHALRDQLENEMKTIIKKEGFLS